VHMAAKRPTDPVMIIETRFASPDMRFTILPTSAPALFSSASFASLCLCLSTMPEKSRRLSALS
jgi:hypothetical protein